MLHLSIVVALQNMSGDDSASLATKHTDSKALLQPASSCVLVGAAVGACSFLWPEKVLHGKSANVSK